MTAQPADSAVRDITLKVVNKKSRPLSGIVVLSTASDAGGLTDAKGSYVFKGLTNKDSLIVMLPEFGRTMIPVADYDSLLVRVRSPRSYSYFDPETNREINIGYTKIRASDKTSPSSSLNVQELIERSNVSSLYDLLVGRVPGLDIRRGNGASGEISATMRGTKSFYGSNEPLVILDGIPFDSIEAANAVVNVRDIKTLDVLKDGSIYGSRGANGVIVITTK